MFSIQRAVTKPLKLLLSKIFFKINSFFLYRKILFSELMRFWVKVMNKFPLVANDKADLNRFGLRNLRELAMDRVGWRSAMEELKAQMGCNTN